ncbi:MAG: porin [Alphaproteobacteria bacterium]|nr:porin [Alphaproteobacteria bacterium]
MKRNLLATSALVAAGALMSQAAFAEAKPIELKVGGYMEQWVGFASFSADQPSNNSLVNDDVSDLDIQQDAEIHFKGSTTLDNGLTFGVNVQLEAETDSDQIDEAYMFMRGEFGEVLLGMENGAAYAMHYGFGDFGVGATMNSGDLSQWYLGPNAYELSGTYQGLRNRDNDSNKIRYISPRISGFQIGMDYSPEARQDSDSFPTEVKNGGTPGLNDNGTPENVWSVAANYLNSFDGVDVALSAGFQGIGDGNGRTGSDPYNFALGMRLGYSGFGLSASWTHENDYGSNGVGNFRIENRDVVGAGIDYKEGPMHVGLDVAYGMQDYVASAASDTKQIAVQLGGTYILGPGVEARGSIFYANTDDGLGISGNDSDGFAVVGGIRLVF